MTYTAEQLRRDAIAIERMHGETLTVEWRGHQASQLRAHADALEENARLKGAWGASALAENARLKAAWDASYKQAMKNGAACNEWRDRAERAEAALAELREEYAKLDKLVSNQGIRLMEAEDAEAELAKLRQMVAQQAEDDGLWFRAATAPEAYLQQELRRLHAAVEGAK